MSVKVYGCSDDLIEVEGDMDEEIYALEDKPTWLAFNEGTILRVDYTDGGVWRINRHRAGAAKYSKVEATGPEDEYSDVVTLDGPIDSLVAGHLYPTGQEGPMRSK